jgi:hypothetical protein
MVMTLTDGLNSRRCESVFFPSRLSYFTWAMVDAFFGNVRYLLQPITSPIIRTSLHTRLANLRRYLVRLRYATDA